MKMKKESKDVRSSRTGGTANPAMPAVVDRATFQAELDALRVREKAHTHEGDAIAAARRRLPMVEVDGATPLTAKQGAVTLLDAVEGKFLSLHSAEKEKASGRLGLVRHLGCET